MSTEYAEMGWELQPVDSIPPATRGRNGYLNEMVDQIVSHPNTLYRVYKGEYKRVLARRASLQTAIARRFGRPEHGDHKLPSGWRLYQRKLDGTSGALFAIYTGEER
jgi:hypothetical protein